MQIVELFLQLQIFTIPAAAAGDYILLLSFTKQTIVLMYKLLFYR